MHTDFMLNTFATLFVTIDPIGLAPIFLAVLRDADAPTRRWVATRTAVIAGSILIAFAFIGSGLLGFLGISMAAFRIAGGLLLFWISFEMVFEKRETRKRAQAGAPHADQSDVAGPIDRPIEDFRHLAVFPMAIPMLAGPGAISATILLASQASTPLDTLALCALVVTMVGLCYLVFMAADRIDRYLGDTGRSVLTRLLGVLLAALSVQFVADGIKAILA